MVDSTRARGLLANPARVSIEKFRWLFGIDPREPRAWQIAKVVGPFFLIGVGPALALLALRHYPFLVQDRTIYIGGLASLLACALATVGVVRVPAGVPVWLRLQIRLGLGLLGTIWLLGTLAIVNGYAMRVTHRVVPVVGKRQSLERDPTRRSYYLAVRPWPAVPSVVELDAPASVWEQIDVPVVDRRSTQASLDSMSDRETVSLAVGRGRLGLEWLSGISR